MSVVRAVTKAYGPALVDIQIEQGADFRLAVTAKDSVGAPISLTGAVISAHMQSSTPTKSCINFTIENTDLPNGRFTVVFPAASSLAVPFNTLPTPQTRLVTVKDQIYPIGNWVLQWEKSGVTTRYIEGTVFLDRDPCLT